MSIPETPHTRLEMYLDAIARNGGGGGGGGGSSSLSGLTDVDISNPTDGQVLVYDAASSKWVNGTSRIIVHVDWETGLADKTWQELYDATVAGVPVYFPYTPVDAPSGSVFKCMTRLEAIFGNSSNGYACAFNARDQGNTYDVAFFAASANDYLRLD